MMQTLGATPEIAENTARNLKLEIIVLRENLRQLSRKALEALAPEESGKLRIYTMVSSGLDNRELIKKAADLKRDRKTVVIFGDTSGSLVMGRSEDLDFSVIVPLTKACSFLGGKCGGKEDLAFGGGFQSDRYKDAIEIIKDELSKMCQNRE